MPLKVWQVEFIEYNDSKEEVIRGRNSWMFQRKRRASTFLRHRLIRWIELVAFTRKDLDKEMTDKFVVGGHMGCYSLKPEYRIDMKIIEQMANKLAVGKSAERIFVWRLHRKYAADSDSDARNSDGLSDYMSTSEDDSSEVEQDAATRVKRARREFQRKTFELDKAERRRAAARSNLFSEAHVQAHTGFADSIRMNGLGLALDEARCKADVIQAEMRVLECRIARAPFSKPLPLGVTKWPRDCLVAAPSSAQPCNPPSPAAKRRKPSTTDNRATRQRLASTLIRALGKGDE
jgi:hypothetical protein